MSSHLRQSQAFVSIVVFLPCLLGIADGARVKKYGRAFEVPRGPDVNEVAEDSPYSTHYMALGLDRSASLEAIKKEGKRRVLETHPDKAVARGEDKDNAQRKFRAVQHARDVLGDPARREMYDKLLEASAMQLVTGTNVVAVRTFNTKDTGAREEHFIPEGSKGLVQEVDGDGDAFILWQSIQKIAPLLSKHWHLVKIEPPHLVTGSKVVAVQKFNTKVTGAREDHIIPAGAKGIVQEVDGDGDAFIKWETVRNAAPLLSKHWHLLKIEPPHLIAGVTVVAAREFNTKDTGAGEGHIISEGARGLVREVDGDGDAFIKWENIQKAFPLLNKHWYLVKISPPHLVTGSKVVAVQEFNTKDTGARDAHVIPRGASGIVQEIDSDGDAFIKWERFPKAAPLLSKHWHLVAIDLSIGGASGPYGAQQPAYGSYGNQRGHGVLPNGADPFGAHRTMPVGGYTFGYDHLS